MAAGTGLGTGEAILLGAGIALIGSVTTTVVNLMYQALTTRQGARRTRREEIRKRIDEKVNLYAELMAEYWGSANHDPEQLRQMESRSQGLKAYIARQIETWIREEGKQRGDVARHAFEQMVFHAEGGVFPGRAARSITRTSHASMDQSRSLALCPRRWWFSLKLAQSSFMLTLRAAKIAPARPDGRYERQHTP